MRILHLVEAYPPALGGMAEVVYQLSEGLVKRGHEVTVATGYCEGRAVGATSNHDSKGVRVEQFKITGRQIHGINGDPEEIARFRSLVLNDQFDVIVIFAAQIWTADLAFEVFDQIKAKLVWVPTGLSGLNIPLFKQYYANVAKLVSKFDLGIFLSDQYQDWEFCRKNGMSKMTLITNGAAEKEFGVEVTKQEIQELYNILPGLVDRELIVHIGSHTGLKGHREMLKMYAKAPLVNSSVLLLIGNKSPGGCSRSCSWRSWWYNLSFKLSGANKKILITDQLNRSQTVVALKLAKLFLFPSNIECSPIVLFEAMAAGTPFLATPAGNSAQIAEWFEQEGVILPVKRKRTLVFADVNKSAKIFADLFNDGKRLEELAEKGRAIWQRKYTWEKIVEQYEKEYKALL